jgi:hypothetical protein
VVPVLVIVVFRLLRMFATAAARWGALRAGAPEMPAPFILLYRKLTPLIFTLKHFSGSSVGARGTRPGLAH